MRRLSRRELEVVQWAQQLFECNFCIVDTETTGLGTDDEIVEIAVIDKIGYVLMNRLVKPFGSISEEARNIHGISHEDVETENSFDLIWPELTTLFFEYDSVLAYNAVFDMRMLVQSCKKHNISPNLDTRSSFDFNFKFQWHCLMKQYAYFVGDWNDYWCNYRWYKLTHATHWASQLLGCEPCVSHRALNDCKNILLVLGALAISN